MEKKIEPAAKEPLLNIVNVHQSWCGVPPLIMNGPNSPYRYISYFENRHGEQFIFTAHKTTNALELRYGDAMWEKVYPVVEGGKVKGVILSWDEKIWLFSCWLAAADPNPHQSVELETLGQYLMDTANVFIEG